MVQLCCIIYQLFKKAFGRHERQSMVVYHTSITVRTVNKGGLFRYFHSMLLISIFNLFLTFLGEGNFVLKACPKGGALGHKILFSEQSPHPILSTPLPPPPRT